MRQRNVHKDNEWTRWLRWMRNSFEYVDLKGNRMFITDLGGSIYSAKLYRSDKKMLLSTQGNLSARIMEALKNMYEFSLIGKSNRSARSK